MENNYLYTDITPENVLEVIKDKQREFGNNAKDVWDNNHNCTYHFVVDANEIGRFCFPVDFATNIKEDLLANIFDSQIAYYDLFFLNRTKPILFNEYKNEINSLANYFNNISQDVYNDKLYFENFFNNVKNIYYKNEDLNINDRDLKLSFTLSILSFGAERLRDLFKRILFEDDNQLLKVAVINKTSKTWEQKVLNKCYRQLGGINNKQLTKTSLLRDIKVITKLISLNNYYEKLFLQDQIEERIVFLYLSSANIRTEIICGTLKSMGQYCTIDGDYFNPWRKPLQVFLYLINRVLKEKRNNNLLIDFENTKLNLSGMRKNLLEFESFERKSKAIPDNLLTNIQEIYQLRKLNYLKDLKEFENIALDNRLLPYYEMKVDDIQKLIRKKLPKEDYESAIDIMNIPKTSYYDINDLVKLRKVIEIKQSLGQLIPEDVGINEDDVIINIFDTFPFRIYLSNPVYIDLLDKLKQFWIYFHNTSCEKRVADFDYALILEIITSFIELEVQLNDIDFEHEITRIMLNLVSPNKNNIEAAYNKIEMLTSILDKGNPCSKEVEYIQVWVLRKKLLYNQVIKDYITSYYKYKDDRFDYGFVLAVVALMIDRDTTIDKKFMELVKKAIEILEQLTEIRNIKLKVDVYEESAITANMVYLYSFVAFYTKETKYLKLAENCLEHLKQVSDKKLWEIYFSEFLFVEAYYEYITTKLMVDYKIDITPKTTWEKRIASAIKDLRKAKINSTKKMIIIYEDMIQKLNILKKQI